MSLWLNRKVDVSTHPLFLCPFSTKKQARLEASFRKSWREFQKFQKKFQVHFNCSDGIQISHTFAPVITTKVVAGVFLSPFVLWLTDTNYSIITIIRTQSDSEESRIHPRGCPRDPSLHYVPFWMTNYYSLSLRAKRRVSRILSLPFREGDQQKLLTINTYLSYERNSNFSECRIRCHPHHL